MTWTAPDTEPGDAYRIRSSILDEDRRVFVALPDSHGRTGRAYPLVLVFDGGALHSTVLAAARALVRAGHMPEAVVVSLENTDRIRDLSPPGVPVSGNDGSGRADRFADFLLEELKPALSARFRASGPVILVGHSSGGLFVHYAAAAHPETFAHVVSLDAPMHLGEGAVPALLREVPRAVPLRLVSLEARFGWPDDLWRSFTGSAPGHWVLVRESLEGESHQSMTWPGAYRGLRAIFADYSTVKLASLPPDEALATFDERNPFGREAPPPLAFLRAAAEHWIGVRSLDDARSAVHRLEEAYGASPLSSALLYRISEAYAEGFEGPTLEELRSTARASPDEARDILGSWRGYTVMEGASTRRELVVTLREVDGAVEGEISVGDAPARPIEYLTVAGSRVHVGHMNAMRPHGMLLYEGVVAGDVFEGEFVLRGIAFTLPDGRPLPTTAFRLERSGGQ